MHKNKTNPYTIEQLKFFKMEIKEAGGVDEMMIEKEALKKDGEFTMIITNKDLEGYKRKHVNGIYKSLQAHYNTEVPYVFWNRLYEKLKYI